MAKKLMAPVTGFVMFPDEIFAAVGCIKQVLA